EDGGWEWGAYWEETKDFELGTYRFRIEGHYLHPDTDERTPYASTTDSFEVVPSTAITIDQIEVLSPNTISARVSYPPANEMLTAGPAGDRAKLSGSYRMHHSEVASGLPIPVMADTEFNDLNGEVI